MTRDSWRVCDRAVDSSNAGSVIAYVERRRRGVYEVVWVTARLGVETFGSLEDVLRAAVELLSGHDRGRARMQIVRPEPAV